MRVCPKCHLEYHEDEETCIVDGAKLEESADPRVGHLVGGRYFLEKAIGEGGMATVYRAHHTLIERPLAVKILHKHLSHDDTLRERFRREAKSAATIAHENVIEIYDFGETEDGCPFLVMELLDGKPLSKLVEQGPIPIALAVELATQMARGLARAHDLGIVHRDLKPENAFVSKRADGAWHAKLVDFGIARSKKEARLTAVGSLIGTPQYLAPERIKGVESGAPSDLYSFGVMLFEMVTGRPPFVSKDLPGYLVAHMEQAPPKASSLVKECPSALDELIDSLLAKDPAARPVDAHAVVRALETVAREGAPVPSPEEAEAAAAGAVTPPAEPRPVHSLPPVTLERWERRALVFQHMLRRAFPETTPPPELAGLVEDVRSILEQLAALRDQRVTHQRELDRLEAESRDARERLGHAVHELGADLSIARAELRQAQELVAAKELEVKDLEFQIEVLRKKSGETEAETDARRGHADASLKQTGDELEALQKTLGERSRAFVTAMRAIPAVAPLVEELEEGRE
ncbi:MAG: protein kinase [Polyangiales bacterium]